MAHPCLTRKRTNMTTTIEQEIARFYKLGQKPVEYISTLPTMVMMLLYLNNKYGIEDKSHADIRKQYRQYGRYTERQKALKEAPALCCWELTLDYNEKEQLLSSTKEDYYAAFYWKLHDTIMANPGKKIFCTFEISFYTNGKPSNGHIELVTYNPDTNTIEHIDSNQIPKYLKRKEPGYFVCCEISEAIVRRVAETLPFSPKYKNNNDIYTDYEFGIQSLEASSDKLTEKEKEGYCLMWTTFFAELAMKFPDLSMKEIVAAMFKKARSKQTKCDCLNDYFLYVIRGYVVDIASQLEVSFEDERSIHAACVRLANYDG
jgi:hypothetical protein